METKAMKVKERIMAVLRGEEPDRIPWLLLSVLLGRGTIEREMRNRGLGLGSWAKVYKKETPNVRVEQNESGGIREMTYHTSIGSVSTKMRVSGLGYNTSWKTEFMIKETSDYEVVKTILENTVYQPNYDYFFEAEQEMGDDGIVIAGGERSPIQQLLLEFMGYERFSIDFFKNRPELDKIFRVLEKKTLELYLVIANSPAEVIWVPDNINGIVTSPKIFKQYCIPWYNKVAHILHRKGKILSVHMDGKLKSLLHLIPETKIDSIDGFTPPPVGDLPISEARKVWGDNFTIWTNFPGTVFLHGAEVIEKCIIEMLKEAAPGKRFILGVTENIPSTVRDISLKTITETLAKYGKYPISINLENK